MKAGFTRTRRKVGWFNFDAMNINKKPQPLFGIHHAVWDDVLNYCNKKEIQVPFREEFLLLVRIATKPFVLSRKNNEFARLFANRTDDVLKLLLFIREILAKQQSTATGKIRHFLLTHSVVRMKNGLLDNSKKGILRAVSDLQAEDIARMLFPKFKFPSKEAEKIKELVTRERKNLRSKLKPRELAEDPDMIRRYQTGVTTPRLKKLLAARGMK